MFKKLSLSLIIGVFAFSYPLFAQAPQERIPEPIIVNGQQAQGAFVIQNGTIQSQVCASPQQYVTADQSSSGWACYEPTTGVWLLQAVPPAQTTAPQQAPTIIYSQPPPVYVPGPTYSYPYGYYPYSYYGYPYYGYPYIVGPSFGFGFGFGFRSPIFVSRPFIGRPFAGRPFIGRPFVGRPVVPFAGGRPFVGSRPVIGGRPGGVGFGRAGRSRR